MTKKLLPFLFEYIFIYIDMVAKSRYYVVLIINKYIYLIRKLEKNFIGYHIYCNIYKSRIPMLFSYQICLYIDSIQI